MQKLLYSAVLIVGLALSSFSARAASLMYDSYLYDVLTGGIVSTDSYKCALVTSSYTPVRASHSRFSSVTNEVAATGAYR